MTATKAKTADAIDAPLTTPDKAILAFRVGIVGHRPNRLPADTGILQQRIGEVFAAVRTTVETFSGTDASFYADRPAILTAVTPLAEGTDTLFAEQALKNGYRLCCPLPFWEEDYEKDFPDAAALSTLRRLLDEARAQGSVFELDGQRDPPAMANKAYAAAGSIVVNQSDLLIAVWDGDHSRDRTGGTYHTIMEALQYNVPVLWISAQAPHSWQVLGSAPAFSDQIAGGAITPDTPLTGDPEADTGALTEAVARIVDIELHLPAPENSEIYHESEQLTRDDEEGSKHSSDAQKVVDRVRAYFTERRRPLNLNFVWKLFRSVMASERLKMPRILTGPYLDTDMHDVWLGKANDAPTRSVNAQLVRHFAFADKQADLYADAYRSNVLYTSFLAAFAVMLAVAPFALSKVTEMVTEHMNFIVSEWASTLIALTEFLVIGALLCLLWLAKKQRWHERWLEYRMLAEWIRQLRLLTPLGGGRPMPRTPPQQFVYGRPAHSWMFWHIRAITRGVRLPSVKVDTAFKTARLNALVTETAMNDQGQGAFHDLNAKRCLRIDDRLRDTSEFLLWAALWCVIAHFACTMLERVVLEEHAHKMLEALSAVTLLMTAGGPALGAALANINNQGEYAKIAKRSAAMKAFLAHAHARAEAMQARVRDNEPLSSLADISRLAEGVSDSMIQEVVDWHSVVRELPHGL